MASPEPLAAGRYEIGRPLGRGGMGQVYEAIDTTTDRRVALKRLRMDLESGRLRRGVLRFRREFHSLATLTHPRIIRVFDFVTDADGAFYTMELLDGEDLKDRIGNVDLKEACALLRDVAGALAMLHARGLVHRDLAPRNVRCTPDGRAKLIDFGVLANMGAVGEVAGTLPYIAPESVRGMPIDGRADLYSLGALAYELLTGIVPYPVKRLDDVERVWQRTPAAPSSIAVGLPDAMDELVMSLLCLDPLGRPASAAEVIERLTAIAGLGPAADLDVAQGYLASASMVGRKHEMKVLRKCLALAARERGNAALIEAESGTGKSRLIRELVVEAQLAGVTVATASCETRQGAPYDLARRLLASLLASAPERVAAAAAPHAPVLTRAIPELAAALGPIEAAPPAGDPAEERMRIQRALTELFVAVAADAPAALLVDDVQRCDEASAAVLAALTRECSRARLLLCVALRTDETIRAKNAVAALQRVPTRLFLGGLDADEVEELVQSLFGNVRNVGRLAHHALRVTGGSPLHVTELARHLVDEGAIRYVDGVWQIPDELKTSERPAGLAAAMEARVESLSDAARSVGEALSVHGGDLPLELCVDLAGGASADEVFGALDELGRQGVLIGRGESYRFRHDGLREALLRGLEDERRMELHRRVGEILAAGDELDPAVEAEVGWHLYRGDRPDRAVVFLDRAGRRLFEAQALSDCIAPLEAALAIYDRSGAHRSKTLEPLSMLLAAGWVSDREVGMRYAERAVLAYRHQSGIDLAARLGPLLGRHLAFFVALAVTGLRWVFSLPGRRGPSPARALVSFMVALGYACGLFNATNHVELLLKFVGHARPLAILKKRLPYAAYLGITSFPDILLGRLGEGAAKLTQSIEIIDNDRLTPTTDAERRLAEAGMRGLRALIDVNQLDPRMHGDLARIDQLGLRYYELVVQTTRVVHHRYRGEEARARQIEASIETASIQLGSWSTDLQILLFAHPAYAICRDVLGLKRCLVELRRRCDEGMRFENRVALTEAELLRERGKYAESLAKAREVVERLAPDDLLFAQWATSAMAETALAMEDWSSAAKWAREVVALGSDPDVGVVVPWLRCERILGVADVMTGEQSAGVERLERAVRRAEELDCPSLAGLLHEARARVALHLHDRSSYLHHANEANRWFRFTENPCLVALGERLADAASSRARRSKKSEPVGPETMPAVTMHTVSERPSSRSHSNRPDGVATNPTDATILDGEDPEDQDSQSETFDVRSGTHPKR